MTKEEIIAQVPMQRVLEERGIKIARNGMCSCPFHGADRKPSMKIYKDGFRCFACGNSGNVIDFVMAYDNVPFKTAFVSLGGTYKTQTENERRMAEISRNRAKSMRDRKTKAEHDFKKEFSYCIALSRKAIEILEPMTDDWCFFQNELQKLLYYWEGKYCENEEVNELDVIRICGKVRQKISAITRLDG